MKNGNLSKSELATLEKAYSIMSKWTEWAEEDADFHGYEPDCDYAYTHAMYAVTGLCEFLSERGNS